MKTGLKPFDSLVGNLGLGGLYCVAGRPCVGKTTLLLEVAQRIHRRYETNVVFATAREFPEQVIAKAPVSARTQFKELPALDVLRGDVELPLGRGPCIYVVDVQGVGWARAHYIAHRLKTEVAGRCDLLVCDGWTVSPEQPTTMERDVAGTRYRVNIERLGLRLPAATIPEAKRLAAAAGVCTIYGIRTAWHDDQERGPRFEDLLRLRAAVKQCVSRTVLLHRPELYVPHGGGREALAGLIELTAAGEAQPGLRRTILQYDQAKKTLRVPARNREGR